MSSIQSATCIAHRNGKSEDVVDVVIDGKIDANGNKIQCSTSSDEDTISSTSTDSLKEDLDDTTDDELILKTR